MGVNRIFAEAGRAGFVANGEQEWISRLSMLIADESVRSQSGASGRRYVEQFDAGIIGARLVAIIKNAIEPQNTTCQH